MRRTIRSHLMPNCDCLVDGYYDVPQEQVVKDFLQQEVEMPQGCSVGIEGFQVHGSACFPTSHRSEDIDAEIPITDTRPMEHCVFQTHR